MIHTMGEKTHGQKRAWLCYNIRDGAITW